MFSQLTISIFFQHETKLTKSSECKQYILRQDTGIISIETDAHKVVEKLKIILSDTHKREERAKENLGYVVGNIDSVELEVVNGGVNRGGGFGEHETETGALSGYKGKHGKGEKRSISG